jgi:hypothetical protein
VGVVWYVRLATPDEPLHPRTYDLRTYFYPTYAAFYGWLARGVLLRWNPYQLCGIPWLGTLQAGFFYPPHVLYLALPTHQALFCSALGHVLLAALSTAAFARRLGLGWPAASVAAMTFALHGRSASTMAWPYMLEAAAWLPLGCLAVHGLVVHGGRRWTALLGGVTGMSWLAGSPQATIFLVYAWAALLVATVREPRRWLQSGLAFAMALGLGTLAAMVQLVPAAELARVGMRGGGALDVRTLFPWGAPTSSVWGLAAPGGRAGFTSLALVLAPLALLARRQRPVVLWAVVLGGVVLLFALGPKTPAFALFRALPLLAWFRGPSRMLVLSTFTLAVLAGIGLDVLVHRIGGERRGGNGRSPALARVVGIAAVALATLGVQSLPGRLPYGADAATEYAYADEVYRTLAGAQGGSRVWMPTNSLHAGFSARLATLYGLRVLHDYEPLMLTRQREYLTQLGVPRSRRPTTWDERLSEVRAHFVARARLLDLASIRYVVVLPQQRELAIALLGAGMRPAIKTSTMPDLLIMENPHAVPRAFVTYRTRSAPAEAKTLLPALSEAAFDPLTTSWVEGTKPIGGEGAPRGHPATIVVDEPHVVEVEATLSAPGVFVLADSFDAGWTATVDGTPSPIFPTNYLFRGVGVPAGTHRVRFDYARDAFGYGVITSVLAWGVLAVLAGWRRART